MANTESPFFSIIIPTYNRPQLAERAIESVLRQQYQDFEILLIDDGSTEDYTGLIKKYQLNSKVLYNKQNNAYLPAARNKGIMLAKGSWICFLDDDDYYLPNHLLVLNRCIIDNNFQEALYRTFTFFEDEKGIQTKQPLTKILGNANEYILGSILTVNNVCLPKNILLKEKFDEELRISEDYNLWLRILSKTSLIESYNYTTVYFRSSFAMSSYNLNSIIRYLNVFIKTFKIDTVKKSLNYTTRKGLMNRYVVWYFDLIKKEKKTISLSLIFNVFIKYPSFYVFMLISKYYFIRLLTFFKSFI